MNIFLKRLALMFFAALLVQAAVFGQAVSPSADLPNLYKVNENLYRGGQPTEAGVKQLKAMGIKTVIDLRYNDARAKREEAWARAAGLTFINIPLSNYFGPNKEKIEELIRQIDLAGNQPVFIHCKRGSDRTGTAIAVYRISHQGWTARQAIKEAKKFGFGWWQIWMEDFINDYYREHLSPKPASVTRFRLPRRVTVIPKTNALLNEALPITDLY